MEPYFRPFAALGLVLLLAGCTTGAGTPGRPLGAYLGSPLAAVDQSVARPAQMRLVDRGDLLGALTVPEPATAGSAPWTVVALCADAPHLPSARRVSAAVVRTGDLDARLLEQVQLGVFADAVECGPGETRAIP